LLDSDAPAVFADEFSVFHQLFILLQFVLQKADVMQEAKMSLMARMGHFKIRHEYHLLSKAAGGKNLDCDLHSGRSEEEQFFILFYPLIFYSVNG